MNCNWNAWWMQKRWRESLTQIQLKRKENWWNEQNWWKIKEWKEIIIEPIMLWAVCSVQCAMIICSWEWARCKINEIVITGKFGMHSATSLTHLLIGSFFLWLLALNRNNICFFFHFPFSKSLNKTSKQTT